MGFKRSRALWDHARRPQTSKSDQVASWIRAILYEVQPVRLSQVNWRAWLDTARGLFESCQMFATGTVPFLAYAVYAQIRGMTPRHWLFVTGVVAYYYFIRWIHDVLQAGPFFLIVTALVSIFTVGLGDTAGDGLSAYSVFNRGFERLMGSIDADDLLAQHLGGGLVLLAQGPAPFIPRAAQRNHAGLEQERELELQVLEEREAADAAVGNGQNDDDNARQQRHNDQPRARKTGKKARRRNQDQRLEMRRQREEAQALGFGGNEEDEEVAMIRLIEDQVDNDNAFPPLQDEE
jgi:hypothetical protein